MPNNVVKSIADKANISKSKAEEYWKKAKKQVKDEYDDVDEDSDQFYKLVTSITKNMAGLEETTMTEKNFEDKLKETRDNREKVEKKLKKGHYDGHDSDTSEYQSKNKRPGDYNKFKGTERVSKKNKKFYNADKEDSSRDYDGDYEGNQTDATNTSKHKQGYEEHPYTDKTDKRSWDSGDVEDVDDLVKNTKTSVDDKEYSGYTDTRKVAENVESFEEFIKEEREKIDKLMNEDHHSYNFMKDPNFDGAGYYINDEESYELLFGPYMTENEAMERLSGMDTESSLSVIYLDEMGDYAENAEDFS